MIQNIKILVGDIPRLMGNREKDAAAQERFNRKLLDVLEICLETLDIQADRAAEERKKLEARIKKLEGTENG